MGGYVTDGGGADWPIVAGEGGEESLWLVVAMRLCHPPIAPFSSVSTLRVVDKTWRETLASGVLNDGV